MIETAKRPAEQEGTRMRGNLGADGDVVPPLNPAAIDLPPTVSVTVNFAKLLHEQALLGADPRHHQSGIADDFSRTLLSFPA